MAVAHHYSSSIISYDHQSFYGRLLQRFRRGLVHIAHRDGVLVSSGFEFNEVGAGHSRALREAELLRRVAQRTFAEEGVAAPLLRGAHHLSFFDRCACAASVRVRLTETAVAYCCERGFDLCRMVLLLDLQISALLLCTELSAASGAKSGACG